MANLKRAKKKEEVEKNNEIFDFVDSANKTLFLEKKSRLKQTIRKRRREFVKELENYNVIKIENEENREVAVLGDKRLPLIDLSQHCFDPLIKTTGIIPQYSPMELSEIFSYFKECISELNKVDIMPPTKEQFCFLCGFSTNQFNNLKQSDNPAMREVLYQIEDYIANFLNIGGLTRKTSEVTGIFIQKSSLGRKETTDVIPLQQQNNFIVSDEKISELINKFKN